jgi:hypothetical protein
VIWHFYKDKKRTPEKAARWKALPFRYKGCCWFGVTPLFIGSCFLNAAGQGWWQAAGLLGILLSYAAFALLEYACVSWYKKNDLMPTYTHTE